MPGIDHQQTVPAGGFLLYGFVHSPPVDPGAFHGNVVAFMLHEPPHQPRQLLPAGAELFPVYGRLLQPALDDTSFHHVFADVQTAAALHEDIHTNTSLSEICGRAA